MGIQPLLTLLVSLTTVTFSLPKVGGWNPFFIRGGGGTNTTAAVDPKLVLFMEESIDGLVAPDAMDRSLVNVVFAMRILVKRGANPTEV